MQYYICTINKLYAEDGYKFCNRKVRNLKALYIKYDKSLMVIVSLELISCMNLNTEGLRLKYLLIYFTRNSL